jgi:ribose 1,5-bisphosphokinase
MTGRLVYVMGPSGAGKDTLLAAVARQLGTRVCVAPRIVTRPSADAEPFSCYLTPDDFQEQVRANRLALAWQANGLSYGIPVTIDTRMAQGCSVFVNGSRAYLPQAFERYPDMLAVLITADEAILAARLAARGRESQQQIAARLRRNAQVPHEWAGPADSLITVDNSGDLALAVDSLYRWLDARLPGATPSERGAVKCA